MITQYDSRLTSVKWRPTPRTKTKLAGTISVSSWAAMSVRKSAMVKSGSTLEEGTKEKVAVSHG